MSQKRAEKLSAAVERNVNEILLREFNFKPGVFITISKVDTSPDLRYTRLFLSIFPEKETRYAMKSLEKEIYKIQGLLNKKLKMRPLPKIVFKLDTSEIEAEKMEKLLRVN
ncbi:MAG: ribosome-binding factor A [Candidatus Moranbacteria bacterium CG_4_9_14_3_um_filter_40_7]|nr:MAG: ribosome-binding factor A [Candidatus Moranbacteria bacterium CG23_combo_of_CG06-09_8_20_14_all_40_16]PJA87917.1 MAG: ribosome-binding factor A [Candidatus Moranbacteria bacterium CG_4_9_14_3_um_filter_40_7]